MTNTRMACTINILSNTCTINIINDTSRIIIDDSRVMLQIVASLTDNSKECNLFIVQSTAYLSEASVTREKGFINLTPDDDKARLWINPGDPVQARYSHQVSHGAQEGKYLAIT